ncbi:MAG: 30S ribosomal protein S1, partial [Chloroflexaceae bacterium]|nr:30S ribosomal protein S1 [Chloroflexaceae bacterium]
TEAVAETVADATEQATETVADATEQASAAVADATEAAPATEPVAGASFTPVEEETDRPRRLKDLTVGMELAGKITSIALYGVFVDVGVGRDGLLHISEMSEGRVASPSELVQIGQAVQVRVKSIDLEARRISLTMRTERAPEERRRGKPRAEVNREALAELKVGDTIEGTITGLSGFGAFVDIGVGKDGLVHVSELSESRVEKPEDVVQVGQKYLFKLLEIDPDGSRISLSLRKAQRAQKMRELEPGQTFDGVVSGVAPFGAFIDIGVGRDGLVHISQIAEERVNKVEDKLKVGDKVSVRVLEVDPQSKRISLTMRPERTPEELAEIESRLNPPSDPAPAPNRFTLSQEQREEARQREQQSRRRTQQRNQRTGDTPPAPNQTDVVYATPDDPEENFEGNATLDDLLSKFGSANRRDRRRPEVDEDGDEDEAGNEQRQRQRQREAIRRTLQQDDEG